MTPQQTYRRLGVSQRTLQRWVAAGRLQAAHRLPNGERRFRQADVDALVTPDSAPPGVDCLTP